LASDAQGVLLDVLALVAGADGDFTTPERRFLRRVAAALGRGVDLVAVERGVARLRVGALMPEAEPAPAAVAAAVAPAPA
jgi:hypothetical protein